jgi:membrane-associated phospholipid phosphatase
MVYALPVDAPDIIMVGFPLTYAGDGWHTSLSLQIFFFELAIDLLTYFSFWFIVIWAIDKFLTKIRINRFVTALLLSITALIAVTLIRIGAHETNLYYINRPYDIEVLDSGYKFYWDGNPRPDNFDYEGYERRKKEK